jgi:anti-anti-sigma factor
MDPNEGFISPAEFIPIAEDTGQIVAIGRWVLLSACIEAKKWHEQGFKLTVSVNVSGRQFKEATFDSSVEEALHASGLEPQYLELEMTEGVLIDQDESLTKMMLKLKSMGVKLALDDFGTGYSSLSYIKKFPIDRIKIDQSFVRDVTNDSEDAAIVDAIIYIAHNLKMEVIAEGVETIEQLDFLSSRNCNDFQGYFISRPVPGHQLLAILNTYAERKVADVRSDVQARLSQKAGNKTGQSGLAISVSTEGKTSTISLSGSFSHQDRSRFESQYLSLLENEVTEKLIINLADVKHIDSSALGILLMLRNQAEVAKKVLHLSNPSDVVRMIFEIACFPKLFTITG